MIELSVTAASGVWLLADDDRGPIGQFSSAAEALAAAEEYTRRDLFPGVILMRDEDGGWSEAWVERPGLH